MPFELEKVIPWGRNFDEYTAMFDLNPEILKQTIIDCASGPASFNCQMNRQGYRVISCDPIYQFSAEEISRRIEETCQIVVEGLGANSENYVWQNIKNPEELGEIRMAAMRQFLADFPTGVQQGRYLTAELPQLPFNKGEFDLALCGHLLFSYTDHLSEEFHLQSILELCRVATEVRIFPLLKLSGEPSPFLPVSLSFLLKQGYQVEIKQVAYEFQKGGNQMLRIWS